jgi:hypothetical protein
MSEKKTKTKKAYEDLSALLRTHGKHLPERVLTHFHASKDQIARELLDAPESKSALPENALARATRGLGARTVKR